MEQGIITSIHSAGGIIARKGDVGIRFYSCGVIGKERISLKQGDAVWFEVQVSVDDRMAINIRKCH